MVIRTIAIPAAECVSHSKEEMYAAVRKSLDAARSIANLAVTECLRQDDLNQDRCAKLYTAPAFKGKYEGATKLVCTICRKVEGKYKKERFDFRRGIRGLPTYRSMPWPIIASKGNKTYTIENKGEWLEIRFRLLDGYYIARLAGGSNYRDQTRTLRLAINSDQLRDSSLWIDRKGKLIFGICVDLDIQQKDRSGTATISSTLNSLAMLTLPRNSVPFVVNAEELREWKEVSKRRNHAIRQARKQGGNRRQLRVQLASFSGKMARRFKTKVDTIAKQLVDKVDRRRIASIEVDFTIKSYMKDFPWYRLQEKIKQKAELHGISVFIKTQAIREPELDSPHIYFLYEPHAHRIKIGRTKGGKGRIQSYMTLNPDCVVLAVDNQPPGKLSQKEKYYHAMFDEYRVVDRNKIGNELFMADPVLEWLRAVGWLGNAGNNSQITQVLGVSRDTLGDGRLQAESEEASDICAEDRFA
ncbi:MAG: hypothetical protein JNK90_18245 [Planctomycetaceae bacterium]|nr:hypothetical protein [Planctomycetaceae bacterium]